jgi:hypothetical protein
LAKRRVKSPDGREWTVYVARVRLPAWHHSRYDPWVENDGIVGYVVLGPLFWFVLPLVWLLVQLPIAVLRPVFSTTRWIEAVSPWPSEMKIIWRTTKADAAAGAEHMARKLEQGYEDLALPGTELVFMTRPAGLDDLDR